MWFNSLEKFKLKNQIFSQVHAQNTAFSQFQLIQSLDIQNKKNLLCEVFSFNYENLCESFVFIRLSIVNEGLINLCLPTNMLIEKQNISFFIFVCSLNLIIELASGLCKARFS